jgi:hypothetical protein
MNNKKNPQHDTFIRLFLFLVLSSAISCEAKNNPPPGGDYDWLLVDKADRIVDWSLAGVWYGGVKGIPTLPVGITMQSTVPGNPYYLDPTGVVDGTASLQSAINAAPAGTAVLLPAGVGNYRINSSIVDASKSVVLRGRGAGVSTLRYYGGGTGYAIRFAGDGPGTPIAINSGYTKRSQSLVMSSVSGLSIGQYAMVSQTNDDTFLGGATSYMLNAVGQIVKISNIVGNTVTIDRPLYWTYSAGQVPTLAPMDPLDAVGVEDLTVDCNYAPSQGIRFYDITNGWVQNVEVKGSEGWALTLSRCARCEVRKTFVHDGRVFQSAYGITLYGRCTDNLVEDNILYWLRHHIIFEYSGCGNVIGYNFCNVAWDENYPNTSSMMQSIHNHGGFQHFNLIEGNSADNISHDSYLAQVASDSMMVFRNHSRGDSTPSRSRRICIEDSVHGLHMSCIGNVLGDTGDYGVGVYEAIPGPNPNVTPNVYRLGWDGSVYSGTQHGISLPDARCAATMWREGNYDYFGNLVRWDGGLTRAVPNSLYLSAKPSWFGSLTWPPIGPDVAGYVTNIPAKARWDAYVSSSNLNDLFADRQ